MLSGDEIVMALEIEAFGCVLGEGRNSSSKF